MIVDFLSLIILLQGSCWLEKFAYEQRIYRFGVGKRRELGVKTG